MADWRDLILGDFTPELSRLTLVADPDGLLTEEKVQAGIRDRGFELITFDDPIAFRYSYESRYRALWDEGKATELVVALRSESDSLRHLPYDLLQSGRLLNFRLTQIFPNLSYPIVQLLKPAQLDQLYQAQELHGGSVLGDRGTMDFILDHVFDFLPKQTWQAKDILRALLRHHYGQLSFPIPIAHRVIEILEQTPAFKKWSLSRIVSSRTDFVEFLQAQWPRFIDSRVGRIVRDDPADLPVLPLDHEDVRVYLDNYFAEGLLRPVSIDDSSLPTNDWARIGIDHDPTRTLRLRFDRLVSILTEELPSPGAVSSLWQPFASKWADLLGLIADATSLDVGLEHDRIVELRSQIDTRFTNWLLERYNTLTNQSPSPPVMVHHVARHLARLREQGQKRVALVVIDGLAISQWRRIQSVCKSEWNWHTKERNVFAWIPTLTPVSRQALFAGKPPYLYPSSIGTTGKDGPHWQAFWLDHGVAEHQSAFLRLTSSGEKRSVADQLPNLDQISALGVVLTAIDEVVHGTVLGSPQLFSSIDLWAKSGVLTSLLKILIEAGFHVALTSDHGNIPATGIGLPGEGVLAEIRGERVRVYPDQPLRAKIQKDFPEALSWTPHGLPDNFEPLFAPARRSFIQPGEQRVSHGGISLEEVIVPFVEISPGGSDGNRI